MIKILFVCHGNICRSPMAEFIMKQIVKEKRLENEFYIRSAATSTDEIGSPVYPPAKRKLNARGIDCSGKRAVQITPADYFEYDYLIGMDRYNIRNMNRVFGGDAEKKISLLLDFCGDGRDVADPWYSGDFDATERDVEKGCKALLSFVLEEISINAK